MLRKMLGLTLWILTIGVTDFVCADTVHTFADPVSYEKEIHADYLKSTPKEYMLVFYGYVGCTKVCSPVLDNLNRFYTSKKFSRFKPHVDLVFVNLLPEVSPEQPDVFAKSFNSQFHGVYLNDTELSHIDKELQLFFSKRAGESFEMDHSDYVYLIRRENKGTLKLINIYHTHPFNPQSVLNDLSAYIKR